jgi:hypothetical protein
MKIGVMSKKNTPEQFYKSLSTYVVVNLFLIALNLITSRHNLWFVYPLLGWGLGLALQGIRTFGPGKESSDKDGSRQLPEATEMPRVPEKRAESTAPWRDRDFV